MWDLGGIGPPSPHCPDGLWWAHVDPRGIEPLSSGCKPDALPLSYGPTKVIRDPNFIIFKSIRESGQMTCLLAGRGVLPFNYMPITAHHIPSVLIFLQMTEIL